MLAAAPAWFADNLTEIVFGTLLVLTIAVVRMIHTVMMRTFLLVLIAAVGGFVYVNRAELRACATSCECRLVGQDLSLPACSSDLNR